MKKDKEQTFIAKALERFEESKTAEQANRERARASMAFENGDQWTEAEKQQRLGRPCCTVNRVSGTSKKIVNSMRQNRPRIKIRPEDSATDPMMAELMTGLIRNIENVSDADSAYDNGASCSVRGAYGYWRALTRYADDNTFDQDIYIERIVNPFSVYYDQSAIKADYSDADFCFIISDIKRKKAEELYPKSNFGGFEKGEGESMSDWFATDTVRIAEYWYKEPVIKHIYELPNGNVIEIEKPKVTKETDETGQEVDMVEDSNGFKTPFVRTRSVKSHKVMWCKISGREILEGPQEWAGKYIPIIPELGEEKWIEGERILNSAIKDAMEPQKIYNWAMSNNMETLALSPKQPWILTAEQIGQYQALWDKAYTTPMPYLLYEHKEGQAAPQRLGGSVGDQGALQLAQISADDIKVTTGVYDASLGARSNETSGKAIRARAAEGDIATFEFPDNQIKAVKYTGKVLVDLIQNIYDGDRVVRLMGDDLKKTFANAKPGPDGKPLVNPNQDGTEAWARVNFTYVNPITGEKTIYNNLSTGKFDVTCDAGPGYLTKRQEAADGMIQLGQGAPQVMPVLIPRIAKAQDWPEAQEIGEEIKALMQPQPAQAPPPDPRIQLAVMKGEQDLKKGQQDLAKGQLDIEGKKIDLAKDAQSMQAAQVQNQMQGQQQIAQMIPIIQQVVIDTLRMMGGR